MNILILGATGMLGHQLLFELSEKYPGSVFGTARRLDPRLELSFAPHRDRLRVGIDATDINRIESAVREIKPTVVINCIGVLKQLPESREELISIKLNALFPHEMARICEAIGARFIHFSTDCVFRGDRGNYTEDDPSDATDLYGRTKYLGEVSRGDALTLRTSIIGHELLTNHSLVDWFLSQAGEVPGYTRAIYSGVTTTEMVRILSDFVFPRPELRGVYHVAADSISKYELLGLVAREYGKKIDITPDTKVDINRSLVGRRFETAAGYRAPGWPTLIQNMRARRILVSADATP